MTEDNTPRRSLDSFLPVYNRRETTGEDRRDYYRELLSGHDRYRNNPDELEGEIQRLIQNDNNECGENSAQCESEQTPQTIIEPCQPRIDILWTDNYRITRDNVACMNNRPCTDLGNSERLIDQFGSYIRYSHQTSSWYIWNSVDGRWKKDDSEKILSICSDVVRRILVESSRAYSGVEERLAKWALTCENRSHICAMNELARTDQRMTIAPDKWDENDLLLNFNNGTLDLTTFQLKPHDRFDFISKTVGYDYNPNATCPLWISFLERIFRGREDRSEFISFIQRAIGYSLTGSTKEEAIFMCWGSGRNGKSVFLEVMRALLGEYTKVMEGNSFVVTKNSDGARARPDIASLVGIRLACASENSSDSRLDESTIKHLSSCDDRITARFLYQEEFTFKPKFKLWWAFNHQPAVEDQTYSLWRRIKLIQFEETIQDNERDMNLGEKLKRELPGILNWALVGLREYNTKGLAEPKTVKDATADYKNQEDRLGEFLLAYTIQNDSRNQSFGDYRERASDLYKSYIQYMSFESSGTKPISSTRFGKLLHERGYKRKREMDGVYYLGLKISRTYYERLSGRSQ